MTLPPGVAGKPRRAFAGVGSSESIDSNLRPRVGHGVVDWPITRGRSPVYVVAGDVTSEKRFLLTLKSARYRIGTSLTDLLVKGVPS